MSSTEHRYTLGTTENVKNPSHRENFLIAYFLLVLQRGEITISNV